MLEQRHQQRGAGQVAVPGERPFVLRSDGAPFVLNQYFPWGRRATAKSVTRFSLTSGTQRLRLSKYRLALNVYHKPEGTR
jgi:hypothetical protein